MAVINRASPVLLKLLRFVSVIILPSRFLTTSETHHYLSYNSYSQRIKELRQSGAAMETSQELAQLVKFVSAYSHMTQQHMSESLQKSYL